MTKEIIQIENINVLDFKREILSEFKGALNDFATSFQDSQQDKLLSRNETAKLLGVSLVTLWDWSRKDIIPCFRVGNKVLYKKSLVIESLKQMNNFKNK